MEYSYLVKIVIVGLFAALNLTARSNDAIRIVEPIGSDKRVELTSFAQHIIYLSILLTAVAAFVVAALSINSPNYLLVFGFAAFLAFSLALLFAIRGSLRKEVNIKELWSDNQARRLATKYDLDPDKAVISFRVMVSMVKVFIFFGLVNSLVI